MAQSKDQLSSPHAWIHELARAEINPEADKILNLKRSFDPTRVIEENTIDFLNALRDSFQEYIKIFNSYSENSGKFSEIKVYSIAQSAADFMVFRNQVKLLVSNASHGIIQLTFARHVRAGIAVNGQSNDQTELSKPAELRAEIGPFLDVYWTYQDEKITPSQVAKFYFIEFTRSTRESKKVPASKQALLDQIKTLLEKEGLQL